jgi:hypothetical protein
LVVRDDYVRTLATSLHCRNRKMKMAASER